jgi:enoyl-CoA hydratase/carnithine racemase
MPADAPPSFETLTLHTDGATARLALNRPQRLNALSPLSMHELIAAAQWLAAQADLRVVLLSGQGRAFCAGVDLQGMGGSHGKLEPADADLGRHMIDAWLAVPAITLAAVHSHCVGGGLLLAAACDLRMAADDVRFALPEMALGLPLTWGGVPLLVRLLGLAVAMELVLDAEPFDAATALQWRFVNRCVPPPQLDQASREWAARLAQRPLQALRATKRRFQAVADALCSSRGSQADADDLLAAYRDPETQALRSRYLAARRR